MVVQKPSKDITYFQECFDYIGGGEQEIPLHEAVEFMILYLVNPAYASSLMGGSGGGDNGDEPVRIYLQDGNLYANIWLYGKNINPDSLIGNVWVGTPENPVQYTSHWIEEYQKYEIQLTAPVQLTDIIGLNNCFDTDGNPVTGGSWEVDTYYTQQNGDVYLFVDTQNLDESIRGLYMVIENTHLERENVEGKFSVLDANEENEYFPSGENLGVAYREADETNPARTEIRNTNPASYSDLQYLKIDNITDVNGDPVPDFMGQIRYWGRGHNGDNGGGGPGIDNSNLPPFYALFYVMTIQQKFDEESPDSIDMTKPYAVLGKMINKLKRL